MLAGYNRGRGSLEDESVCSYLSINLLDVVIHPKLVPLRVGSDGSMRVSSHGNLMWLHETYLAVLIEYTKRVAFSLEDDADGLHAG